MEPHVKLLFVLGSGEALKADASEREMNEIMAMTDKRWQIHLAGSQIIRYRNLPCDCRSHRVPFTASPDSILSRVLYLAFLIVKSVDIVKTHRIQAVMSKSGHLILGFVAYITCKITDRKCVIRVNEDTVLDVILFIKAHNIPLLKNKTFLRLIEKVCRRVENYLFRHVDWILTHGPMDYTRIRMTTDRVTFVPLWVNMREFKPMSKSEVNPLRERVLKLGKSTKTILFVGRLWSDKDLRTALFAFKRLLESRNDVALVVVGRGPQEEEYRKLVEQLGIVDNVRFVGYVRHEEIVMYYNVADVYVLTSLWEEWSNTIMEAMACGVPVIATNVGANPYLVKDGETGFLFPRGDFNMLAQKISYVLDHPLDMEKISSSALESVRKYTKEEVGELYRKTIENAIFGKS